MQGNKFKCVSVKEYKKQFMLKEVCTKGWELGPTTQNLAQRKEGKGIPASLPPFHEPAACRVPWKALSQWIHTARLSTLLKNVRE